MSFVSKSFIECSWPITQITEITVVQQSERAVYKVVASEGTFALKIADHSKTSEALYRDTEAIHFMAEHNFPTCRLIKTKTGANYTEIAGRFVTLLTYIDGHMPEKIPANWRKFGQVVAELHSIKERISHKTSFTFASEINGMLQRARKSDIEAPYSEIVRDLPDFSGLPETIVHADCGLENALLTPDGEIMLIDWDSIGWGPALLDIGSPIVSLFFNGNLNVHEDCAASFFAGYMSRRMLSDNEISLIFDAGLFYVLSYCIEDWKDYRVNAERWTTVQLAVTNRQRIEAAILRSISRYP